MLGVLGHAAIDVIRKEGMSWKSPGGAPTYCSFYLKQVSVDVMPISIVGRDFITYIKDYEERKIPTQRIKVVDGYSTTSYEITYFSDGSRKLRLLSRCRDFMIEDLYDLPDAIAVNPIARELNLDLLKHIRRQVSFLGVDIQGFTRVFDDQGYVSVSTSIDYITEIIKNADLVKMSIDDVQIEHINAIANKFPNKVLVLTMGVRGSILIHDSKKFMVSTNNIVNAVDTTGAGDVLTCTLTHMLSKGEDKVWSFIYSNAVAVAKTTGRGPYGTIDKHLVALIADKLMSRLTQA
ncbi:MAG: PfkB family carbohydrate kinase [Vulcanisaeta sp.]